MSHITVVFKDLSAEEVSEVMRPDGKWCAISRSHALDEKSQLEEFIRLVARCEFDHPEDAAMELMEKMGWV